MPSVWCHLIDGHVMVRLAFGPAHSVQKEAVYLSSFPRATCTFASRRASAGTEKCRGLPTYQASCGNASAAAGDADLLAPWVDQLSGISKPKQNTRPLAVILQNQASKMSSNTSETQLSDGTSKFPWMLTTITLRWMLSCDQDTESSHVPASRVNVL